MKPSPRALVLVWTLLAVSVAAQRGPIFSQPSGIPPDFARLQFSDSKRFIRLDQLITNGIPTPPPRDLQVRFGRQADRSNYNGSFFISTSSGCTASVIGPQALVTAEHCVVDGGPILLGGVSNPAAWCMKNSFYANETKAPWQDLALCWAADVVPRPKYETIGTDPALVRAGESVLIGGYGLTEKDGKVGDLFIIGAANVTQTGDMLTTEGAQARIGDSGGPVFAVPLNTQRRFLVAVTAEQSLVDNKTSYETALSSAHARAFVDWWLAQQERTFGRTIEICGVTMQNDARCQ